MSRDISWKEQKHNWKLLSAPKNVKKAKQLKHKYVDWVRNVHFKRSKIDSYLYQSYNTTKYEYDYLLDYARRGDSPLMTSSDGGVKEQDENLE